MSGLLLSLFGGLDLLGKAAELEGFTVVRGPDLLWGQNIRGWHVPAGRFDGVIGGPPCVGESKLAHLNGTPGYTLRDEFVRVVLEADPRWWLMEAVKAHPDLDLSPCHVIELSPRWLGELQSRRRFFHTNLPIERYVEVAALEPAEYRHAVLAGHEGKRGTVSNGIASYHLWEMLALQGAPADLLAESPFTEVAKRKMIGNGVPIPMGRAVFRAVKRAMDASS